jgi:hypothetical protein
MMEYYTPSLFPTTGTKLVQVIDNLQLKSALLIGAHKNGMDIFRPYLGPNSFRSLDLFVPKSRYLTSDTVSVSEYWNRIYDVDI